MDASDYMLAFCLGFIAAGVLAIILEVADIKRELGKKEKENDNSDK